jgi:hypothetical protein
MPSSPTIADEAAILSRVVDSAGATLTPQAAESLASLRFDDRDEARMNELAEKNRRGEATPAELEELERYSRVGSLLNLLQSKARRALADG